MNQFLMSIGYMHWVLPALLVIPTLGALVIWADGLRFRGQPEGDDVVSGKASSPRIIAFTTLLIEFIVSVGLWWSFDPTLVGWQAVFDVSWIPSWGIRFHLGLDGISLIMVLLTTSTMALAGLGSWTSIRKKSHTYYALLLILGMGMLGVFMALDLFLFYVMWEVMLVPMYFIIGIWGSERRVYASMKFIIFTLVGSLLMLVAVVYLGLHAKSPITDIPNFDYDTVLRTVHFTPTTSLLLFGAFFMAFAVKVPMFPFHTWLPDAHVEAPTPGSVVLASLMLKLGAFGFLRVAVPLFPDAAMNDTVRTIMLTLAVISIMYGALVSLVQPDFKKLVAYSSVSHLGFVMLGIFALTVQSVQGALIVMINHAISTGALFFLIGMLYERRHTHVIEEFGGIARVMPMFAAALTFVTFSSIGVPGTNGFVGEFLVLIGTFRTYPLFAFIATLVVIISASYLLWAIQRILFNALDKKINFHIPDLNFREIALLVPLMAGILWLGLYPKPVLSRMQVSAEHFVQSVQTRVLNTVAEGND
ncbi:MAG TPA: NADH-quinone oxidoreductase subunit M [Gemmatimonadaceae bacterium]|nr:NADH-quinone oxidoreductase subunit M [Gemmatimonadaceae bacterium]